MEGEIKTREDLDKAYAKLEELEKRLSQAFAKWLQRLSEK
jgi:BMFP domain-containing protein YqiC